MKLFISITLLLLCCCSMKGQQTDKEAIGGYVKKGGTVCLALAFTLAGLYALSASGDIRRLPLTHMAIIIIIVLYSLRALAGGWVCVADFFADAQQHARWLQFFSSVIPAFIAWCYYPGLKSQ